MPAVILSPCSFCRWCTCWPYRIIVLDVNDVHAGLIASLLLPLMLELTAFVLSLLSWMLAHASFIESLLLRLMQPSLLISLCCSYVVDVHATFITVFFLPFMLLMLVATHTCTHTRYPDAHEECLPKQKGLRSCRLTPTSSIRDQNRIIGLKKEYMSVFTMSHEGDDNILDKVHHLKHAMNQKGASALIKHLDV